MTNGIISKVFHKLIYSWSVAYSVKNTMVKLQLCWVQSWEQKILQPKEHEGPKHQLFSCGRTVVKATGCSRVVIAHPSWVHKRRVMWEQLKAGWQRMVWDRWVYGITNDKVSDPVVKELQLFPEYTWRPWLEWLVTAILLSFKICNCFAGKSWS